MEIVEKNVSNNENTNECENINPFKRKREEEENEENIDELLCSLEGKIKEHVKLDAMIDICHLFAKLKKQFEKTTSK